MATMGAPLVPWFLVLFGILVVPAPAQSLSTLVNLCQSLKTDPTNVTLQGVSPVGTSLYLVAQNIIFKVPFTTDYVDTYHGVIGLYEREPKPKEPYVLGEWFKVPWMVSLSVFSAFGDSQLVQLTFLAHGSGTIISVTVKKDNLFNQTTVNNVTRSLSSRTYEKESSYWLVSDGAGLGYRFGFNEQGDAIQLAQEPQDSNESQVYYPVLSEGLQSISFESNPAASDPLVTVLPVFGFIHSQVVHLWDMNKSRVVMFEYPKGKLDGSESVPIWVEPFSEYFACSEQEWSARLNHTNPLAVMGSPGAWWIVPGTILVIALAFAIASVLYLRFKSVEKPSKIKKVSKLSSNLGYDSGTFGSQLSITLSDRGRSWTTKNSSKQFGSMTSKVVTASSKTEQKRIQIAPEKSTVSSTGSSGSTLSVLSSNISSTGASASKAQVVNSQKYNPKSRLQKGVQR